MLISKKELLKITGISYGQLYRWKREGLIPEEWFIKQPTFTGQETFFPRNKILNRIKAIQELKDKYSLEELAKILSPEVSERIFTADDLQIIDEIEKGLIPCFCQTFRKNSFSYVEVLALIAISQCKRNFGLQLKDVESLCEGIKDHLKDIKQTDFMFVLLDKNGDYFVTIHAEQAKVFFDSRWKVLCQIRLNDISSLMKVKYHKSFNFRFDDEEKDVPFELASEKAVLT
ncbi:DNA-binding transcriptional MerR regulator [Caldicoprobacter guelmensis]|uniref:DUF4004 family protein n=1 Tax=Caldicoprobacter guelmensis TaxID=1170224 RepID=UPI00195B5BE6|nr:DNA-binding transcriptional MerR regulator [Caldicoprobacter guelmensis]